MKPKNFPERLRQRRLRAIARSEAAIKSLRDAEARIRLTHPDAGARNAAIADIHRRIGGHEFAIAQTAPHVATNRRDVRTKKDRSASARFARY